MVRAFSHTGVSKGVEGPQIYLNDKEHYAGSYDVDPILSKDLRGFAALLHKTLLKAGFAVELRRVNAMSVRFVVSRC